MGGWVECVKAEASGGGGGVEGEVASGCRIDRAIVVKVSRRDAVGGLETRAWARVSKAGPAFAKAGPVMAAARDDLARVAQRPAAQVSSHCQDLGRRADARSKGDEQEHT